MGYNNGIYNNGDLYNGIYIASFLWDLYNGIYRHLVGCDGIYMDLSSFTVFFSGCSWDIRTGYMPFSDETANAVEVLSHFVGSLLSKANSEITRQA